MVVSRCEYQKLSAVAMRQGKQTRRIVSNDRSHHLLTSESVQHSLEMLRIMYQENHCQRSRLLIVPKVNVYSKPSPFYIPPSRVELSIPWNKIHFFVVISISVRH